MQYPFEPSTIKDLRAFLRRAGSHKLWIDGDLRKLTVKSLQYHLKRSRFFDGELDGHLNEKTVKAIQRFLGLQGNMVDGCIGVLTVEKLRDYLECQKARMRAHAQALRVAPDGHAYVIEDFKRWYGDQWEQKWESAIEASLSYEEPQGLSVAGVSATTAEDALEELLPHFSRWGHVIEIGLDIDKTQKPWKIRCAEAGGLRQFPKVRALIEDCRRQFNGGVWEKRPLEENIINVTCRSYMPGKGLKFHIDRKQFYETDVYGCVLKNTSQEVLEFHRTHDGEFLRYATDEHPGVVYRQTGDARFEWSHGVLPLRQGHRVSVSWRWFKTGSLSRDSLTTVCRSNVDCQLLAPADPCMTVGTISSLRLAHSMDARDACSQGDSTGTSESSSFCFVSAQSIDSVTASSLLSAMSVAPEDSASNIGISRIDAGGSVTSAQSVDTDSSGLSMLSAKGPRCFLPDTFLQSLTGPRSVVELEVGNVVLSSDGTELTIRSVVEHPNEPQPCVILCAGDVINTFTESHRVSIQRANRIQAVKAGTLRHGDDVFITGGLAHPLTTVKRITRTCPVYEFTFDPDLPVESFASRGILSHGRKPPRSHRNMHHGMESGWSIPDTDSELGFSSIAM